jgi:hypothetical protein
MWQFVSPAPTNSVQGRALLIQPGEFSSAEDARVVTKTASSRVEPLRP